MEARREIARGGLDLGEHPLGGVQRVRAGLLDDRERDAAASAEIAANAVILAAELDPADVADAGDRARHRIGLDDDIGELGRIGEPALNLDRKLEGRAAAVEGRLADGAAGDLHVLRPKRVDDLVGGEVPGGRAIGIDPHAHRIIAAAEHGDSADALKPEQPVAKARIGVIADIVDIERRIGRGERDDHQEALRLLGDDDADLADLIGQARLGERDAILDEHLGGIQIGARLERDGDLDGAGRGRRGAHVEHVLDAVDLLLERGRDGFGERLGRCAGEGRLDGDGRRRNVRILRQRELRIGEDADQGDEHRDHGGEDRPLDEEARNVHRRPLSPP